MSSTPPPLSPEPSVLRRYGCLIALVATGTLFIVGGMLAYHAVVGTAMPYRVIASLIERGNPNVKIAGITGDLHSGLGVDSITWGDDPKKRSEVLGLRIQYSGAAGQGGKYRVVVHDAGMRKAHIDLADLPHFHNTTTTTTTSGSSNFPPPNQAGPGGLESFEIERVSIEDVLVTSRTSNFHLAIPKIEWTGFKETPTHIEPGVLTIESDRLVLHTTPGRTLPLDGEEVAFQKIVTATVLPALHPAIKQAIAFTADLSFSPQDGMRPFHLVAGEGKVEMTQRKDGVGVVEVRKLNLEDYIDPKALYGEHPPDLPRELVMKLGLAPGAGQGHERIKIIEGSFRLGVSTFQIEPLEFAEAEQSGAILQAVLKTDAGNILWMLPLAKVGEEYHPHLTSPGMYPEDVLARVFFGRPYKQLEAADKQAVEARRVIYFPTSSPR